MIKSIIKTIKLATFLILIALLAAGCSKEAQTGTEELIMELDDTFAPMGFRDEKGDIVGFDVDLANEVAKRIGVTIKFQPID